MSGEAWMWAGFWIALLGGATIFWIADLLSRRRSARTGRSFAVGRQLSSSGAEKASAVTGAR